MPVIEASVVDGRNLQLKNVISKERFVVQAADIPDLFAALEPFRPRTLDEIEAEVKRISHAISGGHDLAHSARKRLLEIADELIAMGRRKWE